jgi:hypothetical protein
MFQFQFPLLSSPALTLFLLTLLSVHIIRIYILRTRQDIHRLPGPVRLSSLHPMSPQLINSSRCTSPPPSPAGSGGTNSSYSNTKQRKCTQHGPAHLGPSLRYERRSFIPTLLVSVILLYYNTHPFAYLSNLDNPNGPPHSTLYLRQPNLLR